MDVLKNIGKSINSNSILVSLVPKITINKISEVLSGFKKIVRMIPNASSIINEEYNPVVFSDSIRMKKNLRQSLKNEFDFKKFH